ncbi:MAG: TIGR02301 family protein [Pseudomonadota bacterium]
MAPGGSIIALAVMLQSITGQLMGPPEAHSHFASRQGDLILLAQHLGTLHRLAQVCPQTREGDLYRERMKQVIEGESPPRFTREAMIGAFNRGFRNASAEYYSCSRRAQQRLKNESFDALNVTERLYAPLRLRGQ